MKTLFQDGDEQINGNSRPDLRTHGVGACAVEGGTQVQAMQPGEVQITAIHDVERTGLPGELVEDIDIVNVARRVNDDGGEVALESEQRVEFDGGFVLAELGPREQRETEVNGGGVQCEDGATFVHKVKSRRNAGSHPPRTVAELKSKRVGTAVSAPDYPDNLAVTQNRTGQ